MSDYPDELRIRFLSATLIQIANCLDARVEGDAQSLVARCAVALCGDPTHLPEGFEIPPGYVFHRFSEYGVPGCGRKVPQFWKLERRGPS